MTGGATFDLQQQQARVILGRLTGLFVSEGYVRNRDNNSYILELQVELLQFILNAHVATILGLRWPAVD